MLSDVLIPLLDLNDTADPIEDHLAALRLLEGAAGDVDAWARRRAGRSARAERALLLLVVGCRAASRRASFRAGIEVSAIEHPFLHVRRGDQRYGSRRISAPHRAARRIVHRRVRRCAAAGSSCADVLDGTVVRCRRRGGVRRAVRASGTARRVHRGAPPGPVATSRPARASEGARRREAPAARVPAQHERVPCDLPIVGIVELADVDAPWRPSRPSLGSADGRGTVIGGARKSGALSRSISPPVA